MQEWYNNTKKNQRILMFSVSILTIPVYGIGLIPLVLLIYLKFGES